jgi:hypothetical protein
MDGNGKGRGVPFDLLCRVAPPSYPDGALARSGHGDFHHPAPPLARLMETPTGSHVPAGEGAGSLARDL